MKRFAKIVCSLGFFALPLVVMAQNNIVLPSSTPDYQQLFLQQQNQIQQLQKEINNIAVQSQMAQGQIDRMPKPTLSLSGATLEQDFESNSDSWTILEGQTLNLKFLANPASGLVGHFNLEFLGSQAPDILHYSTLATDVEENNYFLLRELDVTLDTTDFAFTAFKGTPYGGYRASHDDLYALFPDQYDINGYFRVSGFASPEGMSVKGEKDFDGLEIWAGNELQWGAQPEAYFMYQHNIGTMTLGVIDRVKFQPITQYVGTILSPTGVQTSSTPVTVATFDVPVTTTAFFQSPQNTAEFYLKIPLGDSVTWDNVLLYNPYNVNQTYYSAQAVAAGAGLGGSGYNVFQSTTTASDALGYQALFTIKNFASFDTITLNGEYSGVLAGDLERASAELIQLPAVDCVITFDATVQKPIVGPMPLIDYGPAGSSIPIFSPRGQYDPFQVDANPISGINNREMSKFSLSFVFNQGNGWFFRYNPNIFDSYNINTDIDTPFSSGIIGTLFNYPTSTDLSSYNNGFGNVWEGSGELGQAPTNGYLPFIHWVTMWSTGGIHWIADLQGGYSMATLGQTTTQAPVTTVSAGVTTVNLVEHDSTDLFQGNLTMRINNTSLMVGYGQDVWGPESWDQQFGDSIGAAWLAQITQKFGLSSVSLKYESWSNLPNDPYQYGISTPLNGVYLPIQELYATYTLNF